MSLPGEARARASAPALMPSPAATDDIANIVEKAALILEEELAAGVLAPGKLPRRPALGEALTVTRSAGADRVRQDLDRFFDACREVLALATNSAAPRTAAGASAHAVSSVIATETVVVLRIGRAVRAGETVEIAVRLRQDAPDVSEVRGLSCTDLVAGAGHSVPARCITPRPAALRLPPHGTADLTVRVDVPAETQPGSYAGLLQATNLDYLRAILTIQVE